jgi:ribulose-phosphate 3-epimerase
MYKGNGSMTFWSQFNRDRLLIDASLWSADFTRFAEEIERVDPYVDLYHIDVSDGHFVPGLIFFPDLVAALRQLTKRPFHVHIMSHHPMLFINDFAQAGADLITIHAEIGPQAPAAIDAIHKAGKAAGLSMGLDINPESIGPYLHMIDLVLMMSTPMGIKGIEPSPYAQSRLRCMRVLIEKAGYYEQVWVEADGGLRKHTVPQIYAAGAQLISPGSLIFGSPDLAETTRWLHQFNSKAEA